jgi:hypothetical protein
MLNANITEYATSRRVNVTLGSGKAVHAGSALTVKDRTYAASPDCGGNRATERYYETKQDVTCRRCLKAMAARDAVLAEAEAEAYEEQAFRDQRAAELHMTRDLVRHMARRTGRTDIQPQRTPTVEEATQLVADFGKTRAARALRSLAGQVTSAAAVAAERGATADVRPAAGTDSFWSGDLLWATLDGGRSYTCQHYGRWTLEAFHGDQGRHGWYLTGPGVDGAVRVGHLLSKSAMRAEELISWQVG